MRGDGLERRRDVRAMKMSVDDAISNEPQALELGRRVAPLAQALIDRSGPRDAFKEGTKRVIRRASCAGKSLGCLVETVDQPRIGDTCHRPRRITPVARRRGTIARSSLVPTDWATANALLTKALARVGTG